MAFTFIYGSDEYLTDSAAREAWAQLTKGLDPEFGMDVIDGRCQKVEEVETLARRLREATQTVGLFGGARAVWVKGVNFITDSVTGRAESTLEILEELKPLLENAKPEEALILLSATPIDKRLSFFKWLSSNSEAREVASLEGLDADKLVQLAEEKGLAFSNEAAELFVQKVGASARMVESELEKLATYLNASADKPQKVSEALVIELTSATAEGEFFEPLEAFYSRKPAWAMDAVRRYFSQQKDASARPLLAAFFNRNRLLMMIKAALEEGLCKAGYKGLEWTPKAAELRAQMGTEKTPFNLFGQNTWYLGNLAKEAARFEMKELKSIQAELLAIFEKIHTQEEAVVMEGFFARWARKV